MEIEQQREETEVKEQVEIEKVASDPVEVVEEVKMQEEKEKEAPNEPVEVKDENPEDQKIEPQQNKKEGTPQEQNKENNPDPVKPATTVEIKIKKKRKKKKEKVGDYIWLYYNMKEEKEVDFLEDFLYITRKKKLNKFRLGLETSSKPSKKEKKEGLLGKRQLPSTMNSSSKKIIDVANKIQERLMKFGRLDLDDTTIKRKVHNNENFYEQDEFIDDPEIEDAANHMEQFESKFSDYRVIKGDVANFKKSQFFNDRIDQIGKRNRENKTREIKQKKREMKRRRDLNDMKMIANTDLEEIKRKLKERGVLKDDPIAKND